MPAPSTAFAKNIVRRALMQIADPAPDERQQRLIWDFFQGRCAYCGNELRKEAKEGHIDHIVSASLGGRNHMANRVLSCAPCNEKEKRDAPWLDFLTAKCENDDALAQRRARIESWQATHQEEESESSSSLRAMAEAFASEVAVVFDAKVAELRAKKKGTQDGKRKTATILPSRVGDAENAPGIQYSDSRLCFRAELIEPLAAEDEFRITTPSGSFQMSKQQFYDAFPNVVASSSYRLGRKYHYPTLPKRIEEFRVG